MTKLEIKYSYYNHDKMIEVLKKYPEYIGPDTPSSTMARISVFIDGKMIKVFDTKTESDFTYMDWLWDFCYCIAVELPKIMDEKDHRVVSSDNPLEFLFRKEGDKINVKLIKGGTSIIFNTTVPFKDFVRELFSIIDSFTNDVIKINSQIGENDQFKQILAGKKKIEEMLAGE